LAFLPISTVHAQCINGYDQYGNSCGFRLSGGAAFGFALAALAVIFLIITIITIRRRNRARQLNLAVIRNSQTQQGIQYAAPTSIYQSNYIPYSPTPNLNYAATSRHYPPPPNPPPVEDKNEQVPAYDPTNAPPKFPPPTYSNVWSIDTRCFTIFYMLSADLYRATRVGDCSRTPLSFTIHHLRNYIMWSWSPTFLVWHSRLPYSHLIRISDSTQTASNKGLYKQYWFHPVFLVYRLGIFRSRRHIPRIWSTHCIAHHFPTILCFHLAAMPRFARQEIPNDFTQAVGVMLDRKSDLMLDISNSVAQGLGMSTSYISTSALQYIHFWTTCR